MKKVLLATTALVFTAGYAAAEITLSGSANAGLKYSDSEFENENTELFYELDFGIAGSTTTDGGIEVGASLDFDLDVGNQSDNIDDPEVFISAGGATLTVGAVGTADGVVIGGLQDPGFDGIGVDDEATTFWDDGTANVLLEFETNGFTFAASGNVAEDDTEALDDYAVGVAYDAGMFSVGAAFYEMGVEVAPTIIEQHEVFALGATITAGGADIDLFYHQNDDFGTDGVAGYGASVTYPTGGGLTLIGTVGATDLDDDEVDFGVGAEYDLGGGVTLAGGVGQVDDLGAEDSYTVADFGITMDF